MNRLVLAALLLTTGTACNSIAGPAGDARVLTSLGTYTRQDDGAVTIAFSVTNPTRAIVYLGRCRSIDSEVLRRQGSKWTLFRAVEACTANFDMSPLALRPGETVHGTRFIREPAQYRLRVPVRNNRESMQPAHALSNSFIIE